MAQRDQVRRCAWPPGSPRSARRPARRPSARRRRGSARASRAHHDAAAGARDAPRDVLVGDVDHVRLPGRVEMGKMRVWRDRPRARRAPGASPRACRPRISSSCLRCAPRPPPSRELRMSSGILASAPCRSSLAPPMLPPLPALPHVPSRSRRASRRAVALAALPSALAARRSRPIGARGVRAVAAQRARSRCPTSATSRRRSFSPAQERKLGESVVRQIRAQGALSRRPRGQRLPERARPPPRARGRPTPSRTSSSSPSPIPSINAFALPGGYVGVNTGLILLTQNESELASVLAHEITHVTQHHITRAMAGQQRSLLYTLAALAVAIAASRSGSSSAGQATQRRDRVARRRSRSRASSTSRARTNTRPTASASSASTPPASTTTRWRRSWSGCRSEPLHRRQRAVVPAHAPDHLRADRRGAGARAGQAVPAGCRLARLPPGARAAARATRARRARRSRTSTTRSREHKYNSEIAARYGLVASLLRAEDLKRAKAELATLEKIAPPHPMIEAMAGHVLMESRRPRRRDRALRVGARALSEQDAARLRLSRGAAQGRARRRTPPRSSSRELAALPGQRPAAPDRRAGVRRARQEDAAAPAPGRVLRLAGRPPRRGLPVRARVEGGRRRLLPGLGRRDAAAHAAPRAGRAAAGLATGAAESAPQSPQPLVEDRHVRAHRRLIVLAARFRWRASAAERAALLQRRDARGKRDRGQSRRTR